MNYGKLFYKAKKEQEKKEKLIKELVDIICLCWNDKEYVLWRFDKKEIKKLIKIHRKCKNEIHISK